MISVRQMDSDSANVLGLLQEFDDACLSCVLGCLSCARDLVSVQAACKRLRSVGLLNKLWFKWLYHDFGLSVDLHPARASVSCPAAGAAQQLYNQLRARKSHHALHATAISTDGSCDAPYDAFWAGNMFTYKRGVMYCSASDTTNVHVFARLSHAAQPAPATPQQLNVPPEALTEPQRRAFLVERCTQVAEGLLDPATYAVCQADLRQRGLLDTQQELAGTSSSSGASAAVAASGTQPSQQGGILGMLLRRITSLPTDVGKATVVKYVLNSCSIEGLVEFFLECFISQAQGKTWAAPLYNGLDDAGLQMIRWMAFIEYEHAMEARPPGRLHQHLLTPTVPAAPAALPAAEPGVMPSPHPPAGASGAGLHRQQRQRQRQQQPSKQRQLLCAEEQLEQLTKTIGPGQNLCIVHGCVLARDGVGGSTCPISSGMLYLGHYYSTDSSAVNLGSSVQQTDGSTSAAATASDSSPEAAAAVTVLSGLTDQPWVSASDGLICARAVLTAAAAGQLPAVLDYARSQQGEWIEFVRPSKEQLQQQLKKHSHPSCGSSSSGGTGGCTEGPSVSHTCVMCPVLWFRFHSEEPPGIASVDGEGQVMAQVMLSQQQLLAAGDTRQHHAGQASGTTTAAQRPLPAALAALAAARAAAIRCTPREQPKTLLCEAVPELPAVACEVSAALGYYPTDQGLHMGQLAVHLQQPRTANLVCMKLLNCEDVKPAFNRERGGCNIDMQLVMLRGHELGVLPAGLAVVAAGAGQRS